MGHKSQEAAIALTPTVEQCAVLLRTWSSSRLGEGSSTGICNGMSHRDEHGLAPQGEGNYTISSGPAVLLAGPVEKHLE